MTTIWQSHATRGNGNSFCLHQLIYPGLWLSKRQPAARRRAPSGGWRLGSTGTALAAAAVPLGPDPGLPAQPIPGAAVPPPGSGLCSITAPYALRAL
jgi:hypothetical protein